jgi:hypothetical protein
MSTGNPPREKGCKEEAEFVGYVVLLLRIFLFERNCVSSALKIPLYPPFEKGGISYTILNSPL